jgi:hypothetical protein
VAKRRTTGRRAGTCLFALLLAVAAGTGCSTPRTASGTLDQGKQHVVQLVLEAAHALPATVQFDPPTEVGTQPCRKSIAGYVVGKTGAHRAEVPLIIRTPASSARAMLGVIENAWTKAGYTLDRSRINETGFPQLRAHAPDGYDVVATAFVPPRSPPQIDLYAVSQCLRGS